MTPSLSFSMQIQTIRLCILYSLAKLQETPPPPLFRSRKPYGTSKRVQYGPKTLLAVPYVVSRKRNVVWYGQPRFGAVPCPYSQVSAAFKGKLGK
jgi:hypothetical protein